MIPNRLTFLDNLEKTTLKDLNTACVKNTSTTPTPTEPTPTTAAGSTTPTTTTGTPDKNKIEAVTTLETKKETTPKPQEKNGHRMSIAAFTSMMFIAADL